MLCFSGNNVEVDSIAVWNHPYKARTVVKLIPTHGWIKGVKQRRYRARYDVIIMYKIMVFPIIFPLIMEKRMQHLFLRGLTQNSQARMF